MDLAFGLNICTLLIRVCKLNVNKNKVKFVCLRTPNTNGNLYTLYKKVFSFFFFN